MKEMARVLAPGGRLSVSVWGAYERQPFHHALIEAVGRCMGVDAKRPFEMAFALNTAKELRDLARGTDLVEIRVRFTHRTMRHPAPAELIAGFTATPPIAAKFLSMDEDERSTFVGAVQERLSGYMDDGGLAVPQENHYLTARKADLPI